MGSGAADRARVYRLLARVFQPPDPARLEALRADDLPELVAALERLGAAPELCQGADALAAALERADPDALARDYDRAFEPSGGADKPPNETAHAPQTPQEALTRTYELADIAGFYRAFGAEVEPGSERVDHIAAELEFMHLLAVKQAHADERGEPERAEVCCRAAATFLRDHLGRWTGPLRDSLRAAGCPETYRLAADVLAGFVALERVRAEAAPSAPA